jgi:hypothetical protein
VVLKRALCRLQNGGKSGRAELARLKVDVIVTDSVNFLVSGSMPDMIIVIFVADAR